MTDEAAEPAEATEAPSGDSSATADKQARMDADRATRSSGPAMVTQTLDNALAGAAVAADEKAARQRARDGKE